MRNLCTCNCLEFSLSLVIVVLTSWGAIFLFISSYPRILLKEDLASITPSWFTSAFCAARAGINKLGQQWSFSKEDLALKPAFLLAGFISAASSKIPFVTRGHFKPSCHFTLAQDINVEGYTQPTEKLLWLHASTHSISNITFLMLDKHESQQKSFLHLESKTEEDKMAWFNTICTKK